MSKNRKGSPFTFFGTVTLFKNLILKNFLGNFSCHRRVSLHFFSFFCNQLEFHKARRGPPFQFWASDMAPTLAVLGLFHPVVVDSTKAVGAFTKRSERCSSITISSNKASRPFKTKFGETRWWFQAGIVLIQRYFAIKRLFRLPDMSMKTRIFTSRKPGSRKRINHLEPWKTFFLDLALTGTEGSENFTFDAKNRTLSVSGRHKNYSRCSLAKGAYARAGTMLGC